MEQSLAVCVQLTVKGYQLLYVLYVVRSSSATFLSFHKLIVVFLASLGL